MPSRQDRWDRRQPANGLHRLPLEEADFAIDGVDARILNGRMLRYWMVRHVHERRTECTVAGFLLALNEAGFVVTGRNSKTISDALSVEVKRGRITRIGWGRYASGTAIPRSTQHRIRTALYHRQRALRSAFDTAGRKAFERFLDRYGQTESGGIFMFQGVRPGAGAEQLVLVREEVLDNLQKSVHNGMPVDPVTMPVLPPSDTPHPGAWGGSGKVGA